MGGEAPTKPGRGAPPVRNTLQDTLSADAPLAISEGSVAIRSLPAAERYRLGAELGRGGMGRVVEALDVQLGRIVALKEVLPDGDPGIVRRFAREVQLTARLEHPSIVPLYDAGTTADGRPFYVMRRVSGRPLDKLMARAAGLAERLTLVPAVLSAIDAVAHAHRRGVIHRDLKPANILVGDLGETVVIDWGLAKVIGEDDDKPGTVIAVASDSLRTQLGSVFGTPGFMAPEQARGEELDPRSDVYALGATLYQLLAGKLPHAGTSVTEVIAQTGSREVKPVDTAAPGTPPELVAIVGKALAFAPDRRYPDAGALGEDVRRFLTGQLVAAHHYTPRQRITRFARRHRAPLAVAALATVSIAVLAWVGIDRILQERDAANRARDDAEVGRVDAQRARDEAQRRADQLVVMQARGVLDRNPTHAAAVLKNLPETSERIGDARAVAQAAIVRGAAWTLAVDDEYTAFAQLSADARFLLQVTRGGVVRVWDLDHRRAVAARTYPKPRRAVWVGERVLVTGDAVPAELFDPFRGTVEALAFAIERAVATTRGDRVVYLDAHGEAQLLDVATRASRPLWPGHEPEAIEIDGDGRWIALGDKRRLVVLDGAGRELSTHPGGVVRITGARSGQVAFLTADKIVVCALDPRPAWIDLDLARWRPGVAVDFVFRGPELDVFLSSGKILAWNRGRLWERMSVAGLSYGLVVAGAELLIVPGNDGKLHFTNDLVAGQLHLPTPLAQLKVLARPGVPRVVAVGRGLIVGFELADSLPEHVASLPGMLARFVDDDVLLLWRMQGGEWRWYDVRRRVATPFTYDPRGLPTVMDVDPGDGRVLLHEGRTDSADLILLRKHTSEQRRVVRGPSVWGRLLPRGALVYGVGDGRVFALTDEDPPRVLVTLDGIADGAVGLGGSAFAAVSSTGELVRGDLASDALDRVQIPPGISALAADRAGRVVIAQDVRLLLWDRAVAEFARFDQRILRIVPIDDGVLVELADHSLVRAALVAGAPVTRVVAASNRSPLVSPDGTLVVGQSVNDQLIVVETPTQSSWDLPAYYTSFELMTISPTTRRFVQVGFGQLALWTLPRAPRELRPWLDERTNAVTDGDHTLAWPWQRPPR